MVHHVFPPCIALSCCIALHFLTAFLKILSMRSLCETGYLQLQIHTTYCNSQLPFKCVQTKPQHQQHQPFQLQDGYPRLVQISADWEAEG